MKEKKNLDFSKDSTIDTLGFEENKLQSSSKVLHAMKFSNNEIKRGGLLDLVLPSSKSILSCSKFNHTNDFGEPHSLVSSMNSPTQSKVEIDENFANSNFGSYNSERKGDLTFQPKDNLETGFKKDKFYKPCSSPQTMINDIDQLIKKAEACRDNLKKAHISKTQSMQFSLTPSKDNIHFMKPHDFYVCGICNDPNGLVANIIKENQKGFDGKQLTTKVCPFVQ